MNASKAFAAFLLCSLLPNAQAEVRTWTDATGRQLQAEMVGFDEVAKVVTLRMGNGQVGKVPLGKLSPADVARAIVFAVSQPAHVHLSDFLIRPTRQEYP